jgi:hypothetical protein
MNARTWRLLAALIALIALVAAGCGGDDESTGSGEESTSGEESAEGTPVSEAIRVPQDHETIQAAVDAAEEGDLILIDEGVYHEAVDVETPYVTLRGVDRNKVILDGEFELENGIRALSTPGVVVENMTARNYIGNGFFWTGSDYHRGSYLTAYRNGDYGLYGFDSYHGQFDNSLGSGSPDAGFYIGECYPCDAVIDNVVSEYNGLGYSGTNSGGDVYIINSVWRHNRAGIVPNSGSYELCYPNRETTVAGNEVYDNNYLEGPGIDVSLLAQGNGILVVGAVKNTVTHNLVYDHERTGIGLVPFPESDANDVEPGPDQWSTPCSETHDNPPQGIPADQCKAVPIVGEGCVVLWNPFENTVSDNDVSGSGTADLAVGTVDLTGSGVTTASLGNCFSGNTFATSAPADIEGLAPCDSSPTATNWDDNPLDLLNLMGDSPPAPPKDSYKTTPEPGPQENMPDATTAPAPRFEGPMKVDVTKIETPKKSSEN